VLPHAFPFRLVDRAGDGAAQPLAWTVGGALDRGAGAAPAMLAVEMMAQAALVLLARDGSGEGAGEGAGLLAGVDGLVFHSTLGAGDRLEAHADVAGRFGRLVKVRARLTRDGVVVAEGDLLLALG
jgi:3-hydroxymyristoyl/3-hydroxydecanoyl-(acyl carrier protein) dehydratase